MLRVGFARKKEEPILPDTMLSMSLSLPEDIAKKKWAGDFQGAIRAINARLLDPNTPKMLKEDRKSVV